MLIDKKVTDLLDAFASPDPTPGGGSAAALAGAIGASLLAMVAGLPKTRTGTAEERAALDSARAELVQWQRRLTELVDRDTAAYDLVVAAYKKPKSTDDEKAARQRAIQAGMLAATEVPAETMQAAVKALEAARAVAAHGNPSAMSDVAVGAQLLMSAMSGAMFNVGVNISSLKDTAATDRIKQSVADAMRSSGTAMMNIYTTGGVAEIHRDVGQKLGLPIHGAPPKDVTPEMLARPAAEMLARMDTPEARQALEALARSTNDTIRDAAKAALLKSGDV